MATDRLSGLSSFVQAAETRSFVAAGRLLGISASAVGKNVARLEARLGVRLLQRTTRRIHLTQEGRLYYERCRRILDDLAEAEGELSQAVATPRGRLLIGLPIIGYRFLLPVLPEFARRYPEIELDLDFNDRLVDVIDQGLDAVIRSGELPDSSLMARRLGSFRFVLAAAPDYLATHGIPRQPRELEMHACLRFRFPTSGKLQDWTLETGELPELRLPATLVCNNMEALLSAAQRGMGIAYMPDFLAREALTAGTLIPVLMPYLQSGSQFWVMWPSSRNLSPKLRAFIDFVGERLFAETA